MSSQSEWGGKALQFLRKITMVRKSSVRRNNLRRLLRVENLEVRTMMAADLDDQISEAANIGAASTGGIVISRSITADVDVNMVKFTVSSGQFVDFDIDTSTNGSPGLNSHLRLFASTGAQLAINNNANAPGENVVGFDSYLRYKFNTGGTYYIGVSNANNTTYNSITGNGDVAGGQNTQGAYTLTVKALPVDLDDALSEVPSMGAVPVIPASPFVINKSIVTDIDVNLTRFTVTSGQVVDFDIDTTQNGLGGLGSYLRLFNSAGTQLASNDDAIAPGENVLGFDAYLRHRFTSGGTYYIGVSNYNNIAYSAVNGASDTAGGFHTIGPYTLTIQALPVDTDDSLTEAPSLGSITTAAKTKVDNIVTDIDVDIVRFTVNAGQVIDFDIDTSQNGVGGLGSYLRLFNTQGQQLAFNDNAIAPGENTVGFDAYLRYTFSSGGTYYIGISNANNRTYNPLNGNNDVAGGPHATGSYTLTIKALPVDNDDTLAEAPNIGSVSTTAKVYDRTIVTDIDVNLIRFSAQATQVVDFDIDTVINGVGGLGSYLRLFNSAGQQLASNDNGLAPGETVLGFDAYLRYTFSVGGTYYIGVSNATNRFYNPVNGTGKIAGGPHSIGDYRLTIVAQNNPGGPPPEIRSGPGTGKNPGNNSDDMTTSGQRTSGDSVQPSSPVGRLESGGWIRGNVLTSASVKTSVPAAGVRVSTDANLDVDVVAQALDEVLLEWDDIA
jgi:Bacterial pre-peptidase C-terminal domain